MSLMCYCIENNGGVIKRLAAVCVCVCVCASVCVVCRGSRMGVRACLCVCMFGWVLVCLCAWWLSNLSNPDVVFVHCLGIQCVCLCVCVCARACVRASGVLLRVLASICNLKSTELQCVHCCNMHCMCVCELPCESVCLCVCEYVCVHALIKRISLLNINYSLSYFYFFYNNKCR